MDDHIKEWGVHLLCVTEDKTPYLLIYKRELTCIQGISNADDSSNVSDRLPKSTNGGTTTLHVVDECDSAYVKEVESEIDDLNVRW